MEEMRLGRAMRVAAVMVAALAIGGGIPGHGLAATESASGGEAGRVVLDNNSLLRAYLVFRTPVVAAPGGALTTAADPASKEGKPLPDYQSPHPPEGWMKPGFDDSSWDRQRAPLELDRGSATGGSQAARHTATPNSLICLRGKFMVDDPAKAGDLKFSVEYVGGAAVYLNGQELACGNLPAPSAGSGQAGELKPETLANHYPDDLYCEPGGAYLQDPAKNPAGFERRYRKLANVDVPAKLLVKGANVLAIRLHRAPVNAAAIDARKEATGGMRNVPGLWATVGLRSLSLRAAAGDGLIPNITRPRGIQVWNVAPFETLTTFDFGDPGRPLPVRITAARNSVFSGRLAVGSGEPIQGLKVSVSELKGPEGVALPASAVRVRYAEPASPEKTWTPEGRFDGLVDAVPTVIPVGRGQPPKGAAAERYPRGAVASLWFTARIPKAARAGTYEGTIALEAQGLPATVVPLVVTVHDWVLPDPKDFRQRHLIRLEQESSAFNAGVPAWSDEHFKRMGQSLALMAEINNRLVPVNLAPKFYGGNIEGMVRWVKQADGFKHDFTVFDRYLDLVAQTIGKPFPLQINCWGETKDKKNTCVTTVSVLDPATGKVGEMEQPLFGTEESYAFWKPVIDEILKKVEARGWMDALAFGHNSYCYSPAPSIVSVARRLWPAGVWSYTAHNGVLGGSWKGVEPEVSMPIRFSSAVWTEGGLQPRGARALVRPRPAVSNGAGRTRHWDRSSLTVFRGLPEEMVLRGHDGLSDFGVDNVPFKDARGRFIHLGTGRGTGGGNNASTRSMLAASSDGIVATERFEMLREGAELVETVIFIERALQDGKLSGELASRAGEFLDRRGQTFVRDWYGRGDRFREQWSMPGQTASDSQLLELAGAVAAAGGQ